MIASYHTSTLREGTHVLTLGDSHPAAFPIFTFMDAIKEAKHLAASAETSVNFRFSRSLLSPLEGASAMLLYELTLASQQIDFE